MGLFDDPYVDPDAAERIVGCDAHRALALQAARETITLLKNEGDVAPLDLSRIKTIAVIGPNANRSLLGGYSGVPKHDVTVLDGIRARVGDRAKVRLQRGLQDHDRRIVDRRTKSRPAIPRKTAGRSPRP